MTEALDKAMMAAIAALEKWPSRIVRLFHHNDADGLSSGAIVSRTLDRAGYRVERCCLEKPYPPVIDKIFQDGGKIIVFGDLSMTLRRTHWQRISTCSVGWGFYREGRIPVSGSAWKAGMRRRNDSGMLSNAGGRPFLRRKSKTSEGEP